ncbi:MAG: DUF5320 domain-containing protein [Anaerolineales bacterium]
MPRGDRTGPMGAGPMTGRRAGYCAGYGMPGFNNPIVPWQGSGFGFRGGGRGYRNMFYATGLPGWQRFGYIPPTQQGEAESLKAQANWLKDQLDAINKRLEELEQK